MTDVTPEKLDKIIFKVNKMLEKADSTEFPDEAKSLRAKAKELIDQYKIDQENMIAVDQKAVVPILKDFPISRYSSEFQGWMWTLFIKVAEHCEVMFTYKYERRADLGRDGELYLIGQAVGYDIDLRYMELIWASIRLTFITRLEPEIDRTLSDEENIYRLRSSGIARKDVAQMLWGKWTHANSARVGKVYKEECRKRGEEPALDGRGIYLKTFRESYAREFTWTVDDRLRMASDGSMGQGGAMVFADRKSRVEEAFYKLFPDLRPKPVEETVTVCAEPPTETAKKSRKRLAYHETKAYQKEMDRKYGSPAARAGARVGKTAAREVDLGRMAERTDRLGGKGATELGA